MRKIKYYKIGDVYICSQPYVYYSERYEKRILIPEGAPSNGANGVIDLCPTAFFIHDFGCITGTWLDGTPMCNRELSTVYHDILCTFGFWWIAKVRWIGTFFLGGGRARKNGMWRVKHD
jgi:hypothetical protein